MTQATQTTLGTIKLAGDLAGSNDANSPTLTSTGVTAGSYVFPTITVDGKGRITAAHSATSSEIAEIIPGASKTKKGIAKIGDNIEVTEVTTQGYYNIGYGGTLVGGADSGLEYDPCRPYTVSISSSGQNEVKISIVTGSGGSTINELITAFNSQLSWNALSLVSGNLRLVPSNTGAGSFITITNDCLFKYIDGYTGVVSSDFGKESNTIWVKEASVSDYGVVKVGSGLGISNGVISFDTSVITKATSSDLGTVKVGSGLTVAAGVISADISTIQLPVATNSILGAVKIGSGITVTGDGTITPIMPTASASVKGAVQIGSNINVSSGVISVPTGSTSTKGVIKVGYGLTVDSNSVLGIDSTMRATSTTPGLVKVGSGLLVSDGVISVDTSNIPSASKSAKGAVQIGSNIDVSAGVISVPVASNTVIGVCKLDTSKGFFVTGDGFLSMNTANISASSTNTGMVKIGAGITAVNGTISITPPDATTSTKGVVQIGSGLSVTGGVVSAATATTSTKGIVQIGSGLTVAAGVVSTDQAWATTSTKGVVQIGSNLTVIDGVVDAPKATDTTLGVVKIGSGLTVVDGVVSINSTALPPATRTTIGAVKVGANINVDQYGTISIPKATASTLGVVKAGYGVYIDNFGDISISTVLAGSAVHGLVKVGSNINVSGGVISIPDASASTKGLIRVGTGLSASAGIVSVNYTGMVRTDISNTFTVGQYVTPYYVSLTEESSNSIIPDLTKSNQLEFNIVREALNIAFNNPDSVYTGRWTVAIKYVGNSTSVIDSWGSKYKFGPSGPISLVKDGTSKHYARLLTFVIMDANNILVKDEGTMEIAVS